MGSIVTLKEQEIIETPLLLFECELRDGQVEHWCTHAVLHGGHEYEARVLRHNVFEMSAASSDGLDTVSKVSLTLANADSHFSQVDRIVGWKGARLTVYFLFYDLKNGQPASETVVLFCGLANPPDETTESYSRLSFVNRLALQRVPLPSVRIQRRCPWIFPSNSSQRQESIHGGSEGKYSPFFACGYSAAEAGGVGNLNGGSPFTSCSYTRADCEERGMFSEDSAANPTRRFGGIEFLPASILVRSHGDSGWHASVPNQNQAIYNDFVPLVYGTAWYRAPIVFARNDGNLTRMEVLLGSGEVQGVVKVLVNDIEIPVGSAGANMTATGWYNLVSLGNRTGNFNLDFTDSSGNPVGDPYGGMAYLSVVVPNGISDGQSLPRVQVLLEGMRLDRFDTNGAYLDTFFTNNPAWVLLDLLRRCGWRTDEIDLGSFGEAALYCEDSIEAFDLHGNPVQIARYQCNLVVRKRRSAADLVRGVRQGSGLYLTYGDGGRLCLRIEENIATQQPTLPEGGNSTETLNGGWPAYEFGDGASAFSGILRRENGAPSLRLWGKPAADTPNRYTVEFQDAFNEYQQDSLSLLDVEDALLGRQEVSATLSAYGIPNFSQASRMIKRQLDRGIRGNLFVEFETSVRAVHLRPGDLVTLTYLKEGFQREPFRVIKVAAGTNHRTLQIVAQKHDDAWYTDAGGDGSGTGRQAGGEVGLPRPLVGAVVDENGEPQFEVIEEVIARADGSMAVSVSVGFVPPAKPGTTGVGIPLLSLAPSVETSGGSLEGGQSLYYAVSAVDGNGAEGGLSFVVRAALPATGNTNAVTIENLSFSADSTAFHVYRGRTPMQLYRIASGVAIANEFVDTGLATELIGPPDENYDHAKFYWRLERLPLYPATTATETTITNNTLEMIDDEHVGMLVRIMRGTGAGQEKSVLSNDGTTLTVSSKWNVEPDTSSEFVVVEAGWHDGAAAATSPIQFEVPNREGATVQLSGRAVNAHGRESAYELSPITRWVIGGGAGSALDADVPGAPVFGLQPTGQGTVELAGVSFLDLTNTRSIEAATLTLHFWNELASPTSVILAAALTDSDTDIIVNLDSAGPGYVGALIQLGGEVMVVEEVLNDGLQYEVTRASFDTPLEAHAAQTPIYQLDRKVYVVPYVRDFFGSPASGSHSYPVFLPDVRIAAAELYVTNVRGSSETTRNNFTGTTEYGIRTLSGGQLSIQVEGFLAIQTNAAPPLVVEAAHSVRDVFAVVQQAPTGAPAELELLRDGEPYCALTIPANATTSNVVDGFQLPPLAEKSEVTLNVVSVGQTFDTSPGSDLTVTIRL